MSANIRIGDSERNLFDADEHWIIEQINVRKAAEGGICVQVLITTGERKLRLTTPGCSTSPGKGPEPTSQQMAIIDLWNKLGLNKPDFTGGQLIAFRAQLKKLI